MIIHPVYPAQDALDNLARFDEPLPERSQSGECWCGGTTWMGAPAIRISVCSWATTAADVDRSVEAFVNARRLSSR